MIIVPPTPPSRPSEKSSELSRQLADTIARYNRLNPDLSASEIRAALRLAAKETEVDGQPKPKLAKTLLLTCLLGGLAYYFTSRGFDLSNIPPVTLTIIGAIVVVGALAIWRN